MNISASTISSAAYPRYSREIAAHITQRAAARALVERGRTFDRAASIAVSTTCAAFATRLGLVRFLGAPAASNPSPWTCQPFDAFDDGGLPAEFHGIGPEPSRVRLRLAGDRSASVWHRWESDLGSAEYHRGVSGSLALAAWCAWSLDEPDVALERADLSLAADETDPVAALIIRRVSRGVRPAWWG
jgi:hypothetical protein